MYHRAAWSARIFRNAGSADIPVRLSAQRELPQAGIFRRKNKKPRETSSRGPCVAQDVILRYYEAVAY